MQGRHLCRSRGRVRPCSALQPAFLQVTPHALDLKCFCWVCTSVTRKIKLHVLLHELETPCSVSLKNGAGSAVTCTPVHQERGCVSVNLDLPCFQRTLHTQSHGAEGTHRMPLPTGLRLSLFVDIFSVALIVLLASYSIYNMKTSDNQSPALNLKPCAMLLPFAPEHPSLGSFLPSAVMGPSEGFAFLRGTSKGV